MVNFIDPRTHPVPTNRPARITNEPSELVELHELGKQGRLYEVEVWIKAGRPLQIAEHHSSVGRRRVATALEIALENGLMARP